MGPTPEALALADYLIATLGLTVDRIALAYACMTHIEEAFGAELDAEDSATPPAPQRLAQGEGSIHPDDLAVDLFASAMKAKLEFSRKQRGRGGWQDKGACTAESLSEMLRRHVEKGDPTDVANFCCFLWNRQEGITQPPHQDRGGVEQRAREMLAREYERDGSVAFARMMREGKPGHLHAMAALRAITTALTEAKQQDREEDELCDIVKRWFDKEMSAEIAMILIRRKLEHCPFQPANDYNRGYDAGCRVKQQGPGEAVPIVPPFQRWSMARGSDGQRWSVYMERSPLGEWCKWEEVQQYFFVAGLSLIAPQVEAKRQTGEVE